jgi:uncharacterized repeat protein (TIGR04138 family)
MNQQLRAFVEMLDKDSRYKLEAYQFVRESLAYAHEVMQLPQQRIGKQAGSEESSHLTGQELCHACRKYALEQYGYLAPLVLGAWGIHSTSDLGEIVYNLIRIRQMRASRTDRREDFDNVFDFESAFEPCFEAMTIRDQA